MNDLNMDEAFKNVLASLVASVSLLKAGGKKAASSDKMFDMMISDYERAIEQGRKCYAANRQTPTSDG